MSKLIRQPSDATTVFIGDKHLDFNQEAQAESELKRYFPVVSVLTDHDGARLIPIQEVFKIERIAREREKEAAERGRAEGHEAGLQQGLAEARKVLGQFEAAIADAIGQRHDLLEEARLKVLDLVIQISRKVTQDAIEADAEKTAQIIARVVDGLVDRSRIKIRVNPDHLPIVEQNIERYLQDSTAVKELSIEPDSRVKYGGCFIETPTGDVDARLESQFEVLEATLGNQETER
ncbi:MAG: FliH/SctL family protein [Candidatus Zixiibacteriota bacterium]